jgi:hypothetical protein
LPKWIRDIRSEAANRRTKLREVEQERDTIKGKLGEYEQAQMTELERAQTELKRLRDEDLPGKDRRIRELEVQVAASQLGIVDPEAAEKLLDWTEVAAGKPVEQALKDLLEKKPWLKKADATTSVTTQNGSGEGAEGGEASGAGENTAATRAGTSPGVPARGSGQPKIFKRSDIQRLGQEDPDALNKLYDEGGLREAFREGRVVD